MAVVVLPVGLGPLPMLLLSPHPCHQPMSQARRASLFLCSCCGWDSESDGGWDCGHMKLHQDGTQLSAEHWQLERVRVSVQHGGVIDRLLTSVRLLT
jgi:hypothetical protein